MRCPKGKELAAYIDGELGPVRSRQIAIHIAVCPGCARTAESLQAVRNLLLSQPRPPAGEWFAERTASRMAGLSLVRRSTPLSRQKTAAWGIVAMLALCIGTALIVRPWSRPDESLLARCVERFEQGVEQKEGGISLERCTSPWDAVLGEDVP